MSAVVKFSEKWQEVSFKCPGCGDKHSLPVGPGAGSRWTFNGDIEKPTLTPSILVTSGHYCRSHTPPTPCWCSDDGAPFSCYLCHSFVTDGQIQFLSDCTHTLAGQTVALPEIS